MEQKPINKPRFWIRGLVPGALIGIGLLHSFVGFLSGRKLLVEIAREGFWDTMRTGSEPISRPLLQWFLVSGFFVIMLGHLALWVERHVKQLLPLSFGIELLVFAIVLGVINGGAQRFTSFLLPKRLGKRQWKNEEAIAKSRTGRGKTT